VFHSPYNKLIKQSGATSLTHTHRNQLRVHMTSLCRLCSAAASVGAQVFHSPYNKLIQKSGARLRERAREREVI